MKLRIYLAIDSFLPKRDGNVVVVDALARSFKKMGHEVFVITPNRKNRIDNLPYEVLYSPSFFRRSHYSLAKLYLSKKIKTHILSSELPIIVNTHSSYFLSRSVGKFTNKNHIPSLFTLHTKLVVDFLNFTHSKALTKLLVKKQVQWMKNYDALSAISKATYESLIPYGLDMKPHYITNGTNIRLPMKLSLNKEQFKKKYELNEDDFLLLHVGHLTWQKGFKVIIETLKLLKDENIAFHFLSLGEGKDEKAIKKYAKKMGVLDKMSFIGQTDNLIDLAMFYSYSDLFFFPSTFDSFSLAVREAAFYKLPTLCIKDSDVAYHMKNDENAFLVKEDVQAFKEKIVEIIKMDKKDLLKIGDQAKRTLITSWDEIAKSYEKLYFEVIENNK